MKVTACDLILYPQDGEARHTSYTFLTFVICIHSGFTVCRCHCPGLLTTFDLDFLGSLGIIYSFRKYVLSTYYVLGSVLATGDETVSGLGPCPLGAAAVFHVCQCHCVFNQSLQERPWVVSSHLQLPTNL